MRSLTRNLSATVLAMAALAAGASAQAQSRKYALNAPGASYVGVNVGKSDFSVGNGNGLFSSDNKDTAYGINAGSYINNNLGMELGFTDFGKINRAGGTTKAQGFNLSMVGRLPLSPQFNLLGKLGATYDRTDVSASPLSGVASGKETGFGVSYGLGAEYAFNPKMSAVLQYDAHDMKFVGTGNDRVSATTVGLRYKF
jgi:opacity protein-like surface antigen